jgi:hypothetical protein
VLHYPDVTDPSIFIIEYEIYVRLNEKFHPQCERVGLMFYQSTWKSNRLIFQKNESQLNGFGWEAYL